MLGKAKHHRGKQQLPSKKKKSRRSRQVVTAQPVVASVDKPAAAPPEVTTPSAAAPGPAPAVVKNPGLLVELRRVGILAGIMLAVLILLALLLG